MISIGVKRRVRGGAKRAFVRLHETGSRLGLFVLPDHYYVPFPNLRKLQRTRDIWARRSEMRGIAVDLDAQVRFLESVVKPFEPEYRGNSAYKAAVTGAFGPGFGYIEAQALHGFVRGTKPRRIIEIGSGVSTSCMLEAVKRNAAEDKPATITCIEPYPSAWLKAAPVQLIEEKVERLDLQLFTELQPGDFLFVDTTHTVRVGNDVLRIILEILPLLRDGVSVHFHDIYLPFDFQRDADSSVFQWMETALLHAYLVDNKRMNMLFCLSHLHYDRRDELKGVFPEYLPEDGANGLRLDQGGDARHFPSSLYLKTGPVVPAG